MRLDAPLSRLRGFRNSRLYRPLARVLRVYNKRLLTALHARGFQDFSPAFPPLLSNLDTEGTRIGVLAARAGVTRQAAGQLLAQIERCGYVRRRAARDDARATVVQFTSRGRALLEAVFEIVDAIEGDFASTVGVREFAATRRHLVHLADAVDPHGVFGADDEPRRRERLRGARKIPARGGA